MDNQAEDILVLLCARYKIHDIDFMCACKYFIWTYVFIPTPNVHVYVYVPYFYPILYISFVYTNIL